jgi:hypothetical protein
LKERCEGATLAEVLIALLIISISSVPIFSILRVSARTYQYSLTRYQAGLLLSGLIRETIYTLDTNNWIISEDFDELINGFESAYNTDKFDYILEIKTKKTSKLFSTSPSLKLGAVEWSGFDTTDNFSRRALVTASIFDKANNWSYTLALPR